MAELGYTGTAGVIIYGIIIICISWAVRARAVRATAAAVCVGARRLPQRAAPDQVPLLKFGIHIGRLMDSLMLHLPGLRSNVHMML